MARPRSTGRAASPKAAPARGGGGGGARGVYVPTAKNDIYTALLGVSMAALLIGSILLAMVLKRYEFKTKAVAMTPISALQTA